MQYSNRTNFSERNFKFAIFCHLCGNLSGKIFRLSSFVKDWKLWIICNWKNVFSFFNYRNLKRGFQLILLIWRWLLLKKINRKEDLYLLILHPKHTCMLYIFPRIWICVVNYFRFICDLVCLYAGFKDSHW